MAFKYVSNTVVQYNFPAEKGRLTFCLVMICIYLNLPAYAYMEIYLQVMYPSLHQIAEFLGLSFPPLPSPVRLTQVVEIILQDPEVGRKYNV